VGHLELEARIGGYEAAEAARARHASVYASIGALLGASPDDVALVDSNTTAWDAAVQAFPLSAGQQVVCTRAEYGSNAIVLLQLAERTGCEIVVVDDDPDGQVDVDAFERALQGPVAFASLVHVPTGSGLVNPAEEIGRRCREAGVPLVLDACQSVGQLPVDVGAIGCSVLTASSRKFLRGPRGTGFLWVDPQLLPDLVPPALDLHGADWVAPDRYEVRADVRRFEHFEADVAAQLGMGAAVDHALGWGLEAIAERTAALAGGLRARLAAIPGVAVHDKGTRRCAITTSTIEGVPAAEAAARLRDQHINVAVTTALFAQHDLPRRGLPDLLRASVHYTTTEDELDRFAAAVADLA
jgi:selenocysteine lyase/cysteine desulfurase